MFTTAGLWEWMGFGKSLSNGYCQEVKRSQVLQQSAPVKQRKDSVASQQCHLTGQLYFQSAGSEIFKALRFDDRLFIILGGQLFKFIQILSVRGNSDT